MTNTAEQETKRRRTPVVYDDGDKKTGPLEAPFIKLFASPTANAQKVTILLELLKVKYYFRATEFLKETKEPWYLKLNPAGKVPVIVDVNEKGEAFTLAESGAILLYLAEKYDTGNKFSYPQGTANHYKEIEFLFFHASGLNPAQASLNLTKLFDSENEKDIKKFTELVLKNYKLVEDQLVANGTGFLVGDHISLADIIAFPHAKVADKFFDVSQFPHISQWREKLESFEEVQAAYAKK
ncbi:unnamed protein product [Cyberlindnera jadinii]|uniref:Glutathione S-transferase n=1 Tax=Cyberlindnera jadinii (strain ATCC 18201 / CBS 1600 / BCRC 20928 / JCM 3617 / NBRC 0987 / NRRL Y-1542) TaxID=983966 RepID=A0A0H5C206_CYBJN|nr:unnamed protein product [Cyberlindnera jadinii]